MGPSSQMDRTPFHPHATPKMILYVSIVSLGGKDTRTLNVFLSYTLTPFEKPLVFIEFRIVS